MKVTYLYMWYYPAQKILPSTGNEPVINLTSIIRIIIVDIMNWTGLKEILNKTFKIFSY